MRHECKYLVSEALFADIARFISPYVTHDPYSAASGGYTVNSLYFDTPDLRLFRETDEGIGKRFKLRARSYGPAAVMRSDPTFLEIKRRDNALVRKSRARVPGVAFRELLSGRAPDVSQLSGPELGCYDEFVMWVAKLGLVPVMHVRYEREAWVCLSESGVRVTVDRDLRCASAHRGFDLDEPDLDWSGGQGNHVLLELKFDVAFPPWVGELVRSRELSRQSFSKYGSSVLRTADPFLRYLA